MTTRRAAVVLVVEVALTVAIVAACRISTRKWRR